MDPSNTATVEFDSSGFGMIRFAPGGDKSAPSAVANDPSLSRDTYDFSNGPAAPDAFYQDYAGRAAKAQQLDDDDDDLDDQQSAAGTGSMDDDGLAGRSAGGIGPGRAGSAKKTKGRVKIKMEFIQNKLRRYTTFSKRKTGIMKKAYELSTLTGTQVLLLVASETGHVYTFATRKLQPMITSEAGKALIQTCLNTPDSAAEESGAESGEEGSELFDSRNTTDCLGEDDDDDDVETDSRAPATGLAGSSCRHRAGAGVAEQNFDLETSFSSSPSDDADRSSFVGDIVGRTSKSIDRRPLLPTHGNTIQMNSWPADLAATMSAAATTAAATSSSSSSTTTATTSETELRMNPNGFIEADLCYPTTSAGSDHPIRMEPSKGPAKASCQTGSPLKLHNGKSISRLHRLPNCSPTTPSNGANNSFPRPSPPLIQPTTSAGRSSTTSAGPSAGVRLLPTAKVGTPTSAKVRRRLDSSSQPTRPSTVPAGSSVKRQRLAVADNSLTIPAGHTQVSSLTSSSNKPAKRTAGHQRKSAINATTVTSTTTTDSNNNNNFYTSGLGTPTPTEHQSSSSDTDDSSTPLNAASAGGSFAAASPSLFFCPFYLPTTQPAAAAAFGNVAAAAQASQLMMPGVQAVPPMAAPLSSAPLSSARPSAKTTSAISFPPATNNATTTTATTTNNNKPYENGAVPPAGHANAAGNAQIITIPIPFHLGGHGRMLFPPIGANGPTAAAGQQQFVDLHHDGLHHDVVDDDDDDDDDGGHGDADDGADDDGDVVGLAD